MKRPTLRNFFTNRQTQQRHPESYRNDFAVSLDSDINMVEKKMRSIFSGSSDVVYRRLNLTKDQSLLIVYIDGLVDTKALDDTFLKPLVFDWQTRPGKRQVDGSALDIITRQLVPIAHVTNVTTFGEAIDGLLQANVVVIADGNGLALLAELKGWPIRAIEESQSESSVRGPHEAFNESLRNTTAMIRRRLKNPRLKVEAMAIGSVSKTDVAIIYLDGTVDESVLQELHLRLDKILLDAVLESQYIEEFIEDSPWSPYPQVQNTERPDVVVAALLEGKIAIVVDGTPSVLIVPMTFWSGFQAPDDYYERAIYTTPVRWVRFVMLNLSIFLTPLYVALTTFHPQMLPTNLLISFAAARNGSPFPAVVEAFIMEFVFEGLREAGVRLPKAIGSAVSIVGGLVVGQAAVEAGIVSAPTVIVVATSGIASFSIPRYNLGFSYRILRFFVLLLAGLVGLYGISMSFLIILIHQVNLQSFGVPYMSPLAPRNSKQLLDVLLRVPRSYLAGRKQPHQDNPHSQRAPKRPRTDSP